jgi:hypothetical protein
MSEQKRLAAKLVEVMAAVKRIPKNGYNDFHKYHYALEADILEALRDELATRNVLLIPSVTGRSRDQVGEKGQVVTHLDMAFTFLDADTGEEITRAWLGAGADKEDKGAYKAMTGGEKYFLLKTFMIPTGDDPEAEGQQTPQARTQAQARPQTAPRPQAAPASTSGGLRVTATKVGKKGEKNGKAWTLYIVTLSDGREAKTFSDSVYIAAQSAQRAGAVVEIDLDEKQTIVNFVPVRQLRETA